jgi:YebC/PmpR family DNA-binding regulatory protein
MAGHSKWANIKRRKGKADAIKGKLFSRLTKEIITAVKQGGGSDPKTNAKLRLAIQKAKEGNLPNETIERNIKKAASQDQADFISILYELYGYGGVGILVEVLTDNKNRISSDIRIATNKRGGTIASPGAVSFNFENKGILQIPSNRMEEESLFNLATEIGVEDFEKDEENYLLTISPDQLYATKDLLKQKGVICEEASLEWIPKTTIACNAEDKAANLALLDWLEAIDDVDAVYHNME